MNYNDHPPPHFHVRYAEQRAIVAIESIAILEGNLSPRALGLLEDWNLVHWRVSTKTCVDRRVRFAGQIIVTTEAPAE